MITLSPSNTLGGLPPFAYPAGAPGYDPADLTDGTVGRGWRSAAAGTLFQIDFDLGGLFPIQAFGAFDVRSNSGIQWQVGFWTRTTTAGAWTNWGSGVLLARDGARHRMLPLGASTSVRQVRVEFTVGTPSTLFVGELWAGPAILLARDYVTRRETLLHANVAHETPAGVVTARRLGPDRRQLRLGFEKWIPSEHAQMEDIYAATSGLLNPIALDLGEGKAPYHGRLGNDPTWEVDYPLTDRHEWVFTESGRAL